MSQPSLTINNGKATEFEFDVRIQGTSTKEASVRFVIESHDGYDVTINCEQRSGDKWLAKVPPLQLHESKQKFRVEVITDGYYFCPTAGMMQVVTNPSVSIAEAVQKIAAKPTVVATGLTEAPSKPEKKLAVLETMQSRQRNELLNNCSAAGKVLTKAGEILQAATTMFERKKLSAKNVQAVLEAAKKAIDTVEVKVYL